MSKSITKHDPSKIRHYPRKVQLSRIKLPPLESLKENEDILSENNENVNNTNTFINGDEKLSQQKSQSVLYPPQYPSKNNQHQKENITVKKSKHPPTLPPLDHNSNENIF